MTTRSNVRRSAWGALLVGGLALGWGILARGSEESHPASAVGAESSRELQVQSRPETRGDAPGEGSAVPAEREAPPCVGLELYDLEVDETGHVLGAWLATEQEDSTLVRLEEPFRVWAAGEGIAGKRRAGAGVDADARRPLSSQVRCRTVPWRCVATTEHNCWHHSWH